MSRKPIDAVLLDLDETLYSREDAFWRWIATEGRTTGRSADSAKIATLDQRGRGDKRALLDYLDAAFGWQHEETRRSERFRLGIAAACQMTPGARDSLIRIGKRYRLGLVTNGSGETQRAKLTALELTGLFEPLLISGEVGFKKPDPRIFELALAAWEVAPESVLFVGDDPVSDIAGAKAVGMQTLQVGSEDGISSISMLEAWLETTFA
ncbi:MAG TPA: HAD family hydrolase [Polyangiaceae bacterium]|jgi:putative hydrolase of the HAD superfamily